MLVPELNNLAEPDEYRLSFDLNKLRALSAAHGMSTLLVLLLNLFGFSLPGLENLHHILCDISAEFSIIHIHYLLGRDNFQDLIGKVTAESLNKKKLSGFGIDLLLILHISHLLKDLDK